MRDPRLRGLVVLGAVVAVLGAMAAGGIWLVRSEEFRQWRAERLALESLAGFEVEDFSGSFQKMGAALQLAPRDASVLRAAARLHEMAGSPETVTLYRLLLGTGQGTDEDRMAAAEAALSMGELLFAGQQLGLLSESAVGESWRYYMLQARYAMESADRTAAFRWMRLAHEKFPEEGEVALAAGSLFLQDPESVEEGEALLVGVMEADEGEALAAARVLASAVPVQPALRAQAADFLMTKDGAGAADVLLGADALLVLEPGRKEAVAEEMIKRFGAKGGKDLRDLGAWLVRLREYDRVTQLISLPMAMSRKDFFLVWLDNEAGQGRWGELRATLAREDVPLEGGLRQLYMGRAAAELGDLRAAHLHYENAIRLADASTLAYLGGYFGLIGETQLQDRALTALARDPMHTRAALLAMLSAAHNRKDSAAMLRILEEHLARWPEDPAIRNDIAYLQLLRNERVGQNLVEALRLVEEMPQSLPARITAALALVRTGSAQAALSLFEESDVELGHLLPSQRAVFAAVLYANGMVEAGMSVGVTIPPEALLPEELSLLSDFLKPR